MNIKLALTAFMLLFALALSGCAGYAVYGYPDYPYDYGYSYYPHGYFSAHHHPNELHHFGGGHYGAHSSGFQHFGEGHHEAQHWGGRH